MTVLHKSETSFFMSCLFKKTGNLFTPVESPVFILREQVSYMQFTRLVLSYGVNCEQNVCDRQIFIVAQLWKGGNIISTEYAKQ